MSKLKIIFIILTITFPSFGQQKVEKLKIFWPEDIKWKTIADVSDSSASLLQVIPENENATSWTILGVQRTHKNLVADDLDTIIKSYTDAALQESPKAKVTIVEKNDKIKNFWVLMKVETSDFPNDPNPESNYLFIQQGNENHFATFVAIREKAFSKPFIEKWTSIFKKSQLVYE